MRDIIILLLFILPALHCVSSQVPTSSKQDKISSLNNTGDITLLDAKYEQSITGYNGVKSTEYFFTIKVNTAKELRFDSAWIDNRRHLVFLSKKTSTISNKPLKINIGDTIIMRVSDLHSTRTNEVVKAPIPFEGKALFRFAEVTNINYFVVKEILLHSVPNRQ